MFLQGQLHVGPTRALHRDAQSDLEHIRGASSREHMLQRLSNLKDATSVVAAKKARVATAVAGSAGPHPAAPSNRVDEVESSSNGVAQSAAARQLPSHVGRVLHTGSSDVAQLAATCQEPRSTVLFMKVLEPI
jgi:hypothetical protein